jgi:hypothetical protein
VCAIEAWSKWVGNAIGRLFENKERKRRVPSVYHGLSGTKRERPISKGFLHCGMVHGLNENRTRIPLKSLAIPAGFEPATHGVEIRYSSQGTVRLPGQGGHPRRDPVRHQSCR